MSLANETVFIRSSGDMSFVQVSDIQGKLILGREVNSTETYIDTFNWKSGIYIFKIYTQNAIITKKMSVIK
jgi:hypothetical protein